MGLCDPESDRIVEIEAKEGSHVRKEDQASGPARHCGA